MGGQLKTNLQKESPELTYNVSPYRCIVAAVTGTVHSGQVHYTQYNLELEGTLPNSQTEVQMKKVARSRVCVVFPAEKLTVPPNGKYNYDGRMCAAQTSRSGGCSVYCKRN